MLAEATSTLFRNALLASASLVAFGAGLALHGASAQEVPDAIAPAPVELAISDHDPLTCAPDPLVLPAGSRVELILVNRSVNSATILIDDLLQAQVQTDGSDLAGAAAAEMTEGYLLGPGQERSLSLITEDPGVFTFECRSPAADDQAGDAPALVFTGLVRVERD